MRPVSVRTGLPGSRGPELVASTCQETLHRRAEGFPRVCLHGRFDKHPVVATAGGGCRILPRCGLVRRKEAPWNTKPEFGSMFYGASRHRAGSG